tara:strand:- start:585 stop:2555 length:1971 start_codon:yes stop_codon:yes gene_type:complete
MTNSDQETIDRLLLLAGLLEFKEKESSIQYMDRVLKLKDPNFQDVYTIKGFKFVEKRQIEGKENPGYVFKYDSRNVDMTRLEGDQVCWKNPNYEPPSSESDIAQSDEMEKFLEMSLTIHSLNHGKREFVIVLDESKMEESLNFLEGVDAMTEFKEFSLKKHQASVERIVNAYLNKLGISGTDDYLNALIQDSQNSSTSKNQQTQSSEDSSTLEKNAEDHNELAFSLIEKNSIVQETNGDLEEIIKRIRDLDNSYLAIQGPPGTGKTYNGAHIIHSLITATQGEGIKIGITAQSYSAIDNLLLKTIEVFEGEISNLPMLRAFKKKGKKNHLGIARRLLDDDYGGLSWRAPRSRDANLVADSSWGFVDVLEDDKKFDYLFIDEAGQFALFDAIACCASAKNIIFLGDPQQLPQVTQASHEFGAGQSVLEYLIGDNDVIDADKGVLLGTTYRLRPEICEYVSTEFYEGKLKTEERCEKREISGVGNGLFWVDANHKEECVNQSQEEAGIVKQVINDLINQTFHKYDDQTRERVEVSLKEDDFVIVTPYNAQRHLILNTLSEKFPKIKVGTVDDFQGKEAPVVIYSMATTSRDLVPPGRGDFIYKANRLNVAVSRAQCLAIVVANRALVEAHASNISEMKDMNHLCRIFEDSNIAQEWVL